jgi:hypothetical protein
MVVNCDVWHKTIKTKKTGIQIRKHWPFTRWCYLIVFEYPHTIQPVEPRAGQRSWRLILDPGVSRGGALIAIIPAIFVDAAALARRSTPNSNCGDARPARAKEKRPTGAVPAGLSRGSHWPLNNKRSFLPGESEQMGHPVWPKDRMRSTSERCEKKKVESHTSGGGEARGRCIDDPARGRGAGFQD